MYFDNDYVRVLTTHSHSQLVSLLAHHGPSKHIVLHLSCSNCSTCNSLDNDLASLSLQYPADCLFLRCNVSKLADTAQWAGVDPSNQASMQPIVRVLPLGAEQQNKVDIAAAHTPLGGNSESHGSEAERIVREIKDILVNKLRAVHFNDWAGDTSSNLIEDRISTHRLLHDHDHDHEIGSGQANNNDKAPIPFDEMPPAMATLLASPITGSVTHRPDSGRASSEELCQDNHNDLHEHDRTDDGACCASSDEEGDPYEADEDEDICPCCRDRLAAESRSASASSSRSSVSRSRTRSRSSTASSSNANAASRVRPSRIDTGRKQDPGNGQGNDDHHLTNDIDDVVAIGQSGSIPTSPLVGRIRRQLPRTSSSSVHGPETEDGSDPLAAYVDRLEAIKRGDALPSEASEASGVAAAVGRFVMDNAVSLVSFLLLVVALALTVRIEIVPADAKVGR